MRVTLRSVTHRAQWNGHDLITECRLLLVVPKRRQRRRGAFWCRSEETTIIVDYDEPVDCMTCLVLEARGG